MKEVKGTQKSQWMKYGEISAKKKVTRLSIKLNDT